MMSSKLILLAILAVTSLNQRSVEGCAVVENLVSGVPDSQITASSSFDYRYVPSRARLNTTYDHPMGGAWIPRTADDQWIQVEFNRSESIVGVQTQGRNGQYEQWVTTFKVSYSQDGVSWVDYTDTDGVLKVFDANFDQDSIVTNALKAEAKYIRVYPLTWKGGKPNLRVDFLVCGCAVVEDLVSGVPDIQITASSFFDYRYAPSRARLNTTYDDPMGGAWIPLDTGDQWIQVQFNKSESIVGVQTQGRNGQYENWVTTFKVSYSQNGASWVDYTDTDGVLKVFNANIDQDSIVTNALEVEAKYIRVYPLTWNNAGQPNMRFDVLACVNPERGSDPE